MKLRRCRLAVAIALAAHCSAVAQDKPVETPPTWQDMLARGVVPYRQLTVEDIPVNDTVHPKQAFYIKTAVQPHYHFVLKPHTNGFIYAYIDQWMIFSGLDKKETARKSTFKTMKADLPYAQALLDISELKARQLAALKPGELPSGRGASFDAARADMEGKLKQFLEQKYQQSEAEMEVFAKATNNGENRKKVRELAADIRKRLDATPASTVPFTQATAQSPSPSPSAPGPAPVAETPTPQPSAR